MIDLTNNTTLQEQYAERNQRAMASYTDPTPEEQAQAQALRRRLDEAEARQAAEDADEAEYLRLHPEARGS
jgi:plasmid rolling circle replication initiator protein Rep